MNTTTMTQSTTATEFKVNNTEKKIKTNELIGIMEERASRRFDRYDSFGALYEGVRNGDVIMTPNATGQFFSKIGLDKGLAERLTPNVMDSVILELVSEADSKSKLNGLVRYEKGLDGKTYCRAVLSKDYAVLDTLPLIQAARGVLGDSLIIRDYVDDDDSVRLTVVLGDPIHLGTIDNKPDVYFNLWSISNSETGNQSHNTNLGLWRMWCLNGAMSKSANLGSQSVRHYGAGKSDIFDKLKGIDVNKLLASNLNLVDMYKNSKGIYVPKHEAETIIESYVEGAELPKKMTESAKTLKTLKYRGESFFDTFNAITEAIHRGTPNIKTRFDREAKVTSYTQEIMSKVAKGERIVEAIVMPKAK